MAESINGWTMPDWTTYDLRGLLKERTKYEDAIKQHESNPAAVDGSELGYWRAHLQSINAAIELQELIGQKNKEKL